MANADAQALSLNGLDGSNPLAFLAAIGTLRTLAVAEIRSNPRLAWVAHEGAWMPQISSGKILSKDELIEILVPALRRHSTPEFNFAKDLNLEPEEFKRAAVEARDNATQCDRRYADFLAAFGCEVLVDKGTKKIQDTALRTMSGAGHQHFLGTMKELAKAANAARLRMSLFRSWDYFDKKLGLRWDPEEDRRYALRWGNPSGDTIQTMHGANRLAVEALPLFTAFPGPRQLETTGFSKRGKAVSFTWPIWTGALSLDVVRSLLSLPELQESTPNRTALNAMGVVEIYRSLRITVGKYRNFTQARPA